MVPCCIIFQCSYVHDTRFSEGDGCQVSLCALSLLEFIFLLVSVALCWPFEGFWAAMFMLCASWLAVGLCVFPFEFSDQGVVFWKRFVVVLAACGTGFV